jgi:hypothetical protein
VTNFLNFNIEHNVTNNITNFIEIRGSLYLYTNKMTNEKNMENVKKKKKHILNIQILEYIGTHSAFSLLNEKNIL